MARASSAWAHHYWVSLKGPLEMNFVAGINAGYAGFDLDYVCKKDQSMVHKVKEVQIVYT